MVSFIIFRYFEIKNRIANCDLFNEIWRVISTVMNVTATLLIYEHDLILGEVGEFAFRNKQSSHQISTRGSTLNLYLVLSC